MKFLSFVLLFTYFTTQKPPLIPYRTVELSDKNLHVSLRTSAQNYQIYLQAHSHDALIKEAGILIPKDSLAHFLGELQQAYHKYKEWTKVAKKNQVTEYSKDIPLASRTSAFFISAGQFHYAHALPLHYTFKASPSRKGVRTQVLLNSTKFLSHSNEYIHCKGFSIPLSSSRDFEDLIAALQPNKIEEFLQRKTQDQWFAN